MSPPGGIIRLFASFAGFFSFLSPVFDLAIRLWVAKEFIMAGLTKIQSWPSTLALFEYEYEVPLLPPELAAYLGTAAELVLPVFIALGLAARPASLALFIFNIVAVYAYGSFLFTVEGAAGLQQHILWGVMMLVTLFHGPGKLSLDYLISRRYGPESTQE
jgi:putative oxidoreductase